jgi:hypothetical protein
MRDNKGKTGLGIKGIRAPKEFKEAQAAKEIKGIRAPKEFREARETKGIRGIRARKDLKGLAHKGFRG